MPDNVYSFGNVQNKNAPKRLIPERLIKARRAKPYTQTELAAEVGLTRQAISSFEQGSKKPDGSTMFAIANALQQPLAYFFADMPEPFGLFSARTFRAFGVKTKRRNDRCEVFSEWLSSIAAFYSSKVNLPAPNVPHVHGPKDGSIYKDEEIEDAAISVRRSWGLGDGPIGNLIKLIESRGIMVAHLPMHDETVNAFSFWSGSIPFVITGTDKTTAARRRFDMAHELGHLVLHQGISEAELEEKDVLDRVESEANRFAGAFLLPSTTYPNEVFTSRLEAFEHLKERWKVSISAQIYRCSDLGIFSEHQILNLRKQMSARRWRTNEPLDDVLPVEKPTLISKAVELLLSSGTKTASDLLSEINLSPQIIEGLSGIPAGTLSVAPSDASVVRLK